MNLREDITCKCCNDIFVDPVTLSCCGESVCKKHLDEIFSKKVTRSSKCPICKENLPSEMKISVNKALKSLIDRELHKINIDSNHQNVLNDFKQKIQTIQALNNNSEAKIDSKFKIIKENVYQDKSNAKKEIDKLAEEILNKIATHENESKSSLTSYTKLIADMSAKFSEYEKCLKSLNSTDEERKTKSGEIQDTIKFLETEIKSYKNVFSENSSIDYEPMKASISDFFGKLKTVNPVEIQQIQPNTNRSQQPVEEEILFINENEFNGVEIKLEPRHVTQLNLPFPFSSNYILFYV